MSSRSISSLLATLLERLEGQEALDLEFKTARGGLPRTLWSTVSAFANTRGGWIVLGVEEQEETPTVVGVTNPSALLAALNDLLRNPEKISYPICGAGDVSTETVGDKPVIVARVPAAPRKIRPVYINGNPYKGTYIRRSSGDYRCTKPEVDRMIRESSDAPADSTILPHFGSDDLDRDAFARYRRRYQTAQPASPFNGYDDKRFLRSVGAFRRDRESGDEGLTVAGLLMFGTPDALREWRTRHLIDYRLVSSESDFDKRWDDRIPWEAGLFTAFETIYPRLIAGQPVPFRLEGGTRIDESPVHVALREALVNLLVHADYSETQASLVIQSEQGYLFRNPGSSRVLETDLLNGDRSDPRNPELVRMFRLVGFAEEAGTGIPKIIRAWRDLGFHLPKIDIGTERYEFSLELRHAHLLSDEDRTWLSSIDENWNESEQLALVLARHEGEVDNLKLRRLTGQHSADVTKVLGSLRGRGLLQMIGGGRGARYQLGAVAPPRSPFAGDFGAEKGKGAVQLPLEESPGKLEIAGAGSGDNESGSGSRDPSSGTKEPSSGDNAPSFGGKMAIPPEVWRDLREISRQAREQLRLRPSTRDAILLRLCARRPLSLRELAELIGRSQDYVHKLVPPLLASGRLTYLYPEHPNHPHQKYVAVSSTPNPM